MPEWMSQPGITFMTSAIEYMLTPLMKTVISPNQTAESARPGSP
jgi:hypothetical protein